MKKIVNSLLLIVLFVSQAVITVYFTMNHAEKRLYEGKRQSFKYEIDDSIPFLSFENDPTILLENPDRGFRMESYLTLGTNITYPGKKLTQTDEESTPTLSGANESLHSQIEHFGEDKPQIIQQYIYLTLYSERAEIPEKALTQLKQYFEYIRTLNLKMLLRFAYLTENNPTDPTHKILFSHIAQLKQWFADNDQLVADTVYCLQLGFIGLWGEGHSYKYNYDIPGIIKAVIEMMPSWMYMNVRTFEFYDQVPLNYRSRVGIHDDYIVGYLMGWNFMPDDTFKQPYLRDLFQKTINDGELPWGRDIQQTDYIDGKGVIKSAYDYSLSTLSITHNYIESGIDNPYNMYRWKSENLTVNDFNNYGWNYNPNLLNEKGEISIFKYLQYHLGYQLVLSNLAIQNGKLSFVISNYGFAAPFNMDKLVMQVKNKDTSTIYVNLTFTPHELYTYSQSVYSVVLDFDNVESVSVKMYNSRNNNYVRFANNIASNNGYYKIL